VICKKCGCAGFGQADLCSECSQIQKLLAQIAVLKGVCEKIRLTPLDDKTPARYIKALGEWREYACKTAFDALAEFEKLEKGREG